MGMPKWKLPPTSSRGADPQNSMGTSETLGRGSVQFMTVDGVRHSSTTSVPPVAIIRWAARENAPEPELRPVRGEFVAKARKNQSHTRRLVGSGAGVGFLQLNQDVNMYVAEPGAGKHASPPVALALAASICAIDRGHCRHAPASGVQRAPCAP